MVIGSSSIMNVLTFDIEDWFHLLDHPSTKTEKQWANFPSRLDQNTDKILELLSDFNLKATFFCLGWVAKQYPNIIRRIADSGHELGCHSNMHQLVYEQTPAEFKTDLKEALQRLGDVSGKKIDCYRAPGFSITHENMWAIEELIAHGIKIDCSIFPASRAHGGLPNFHSSRPCKIQTASGILKEFPLNTASVLGKKFVFSGGGYFRFFPISLLKILIKNSDYNMLYFHPRDFDPDQPVLPDLKFVRKFKSYYGLRRCEAKLRDVLKNHNVIDLHKADELINWQSVQTHLLKH